MKWDDLSALWQQVRLQKNSRWYIYAIGETLPQAPASDTQLEQFIDSIDHLLREEHEHDYCGIVYVDDATTPTFVKIYDPNNLGVVCGYSDNPPLPGWVMSQQAPIDLQQAFPPPANRKRWWRRIFS